MRRSMRYRSGFLELEIYVPRPRVGILAPVLSVTNLEAGMLEEGICFRGRTLSKLPFYTLSVGVASGLVWKFISYIVF